MTDVQPAIETIRRFLGEISPCGRFVTQGSPSVYEALAALSAVEADLRRKDEALREIANPENDSSELRRIARAALAPVSSSEPVPEELCPDCGERRTVGCGCWLDRLDHPWAKKSRSTEPVLQQTEDGR